MPDAGVAALLLSPPGLGLLGLLVGSFLNVVVHRLPAMLWRDWWKDSVDFQLADPQAWQPLFGAKSRPPTQLAAAAAAVSAELTKLPELSLLKPRSRCPQCAHVLRWYENIPVLSWLVLRGRCSACKTRISARYPVVELFTAALFAAAAASFGARPQTLLWCLAIALLLTMALIDFDTTLLPDGLTLPLIGLGIAGALAGWTQVTPAEAAAGALAGYGVLWAVGWLYGRLRGVNAMAEGDMKMFAGIGALLGWQALPSALMLAAGAGAVIGVTLILAFGRDRSKPIPFGPYLALGGLCSIFFGSDLRELWQL
ncbi:MAG: prepilin peptidase [Chitinophagaceae bacterium]|nr:prepilin peptidase [Rubrivivax sp.]